MSVDSSFAELMSRLRSGDQTAAAEIFHRFAHRLIGLARSRLGPQVRRKTDPEDVLQSVFKSFFRRESESAFVIGDWNSLWAILATITLHKCGHRIEYFRAAKRDYRREDSLPVSTEESTASWQALAREPTPAEAAALADTVEAVMRGLDPYQRDIVQLALQGFDTAAISQEVGYTQRTVQRVLERIRHKLEKQRNDSSG
jgi:RNA polymerase sigma-70 factor (ECF subfamily)